MIYILKSKNLIGGGAQEMSRKRAPQIKFFLERTTGIHILKLYIQIHTNCVQNIEGKNFKNYNVEILVRRSL